ncbi:Response regulator of zinc sigma-54-dependent two-component system [hydrothermal vent metagenome]|uniref:Response regulator of zinc sigma-54-dependent two-component system n=1 Tax=hydrothermal vent metagenome TaxID=652676 RepID=A0A3B1BSK5_9ZZZZ
MTIFQNDFIGSSPQLTSVIRSAKVVASTDVTILISGESGTGKELLASAIHKESRRANGPLITINCSAIPEALAESELFGHRKGSFTGATSDYDGLIKAADGGTLFLDEVGELPLSVQAKLLRFLETGERQGLGEPSPSKVDVRVISATNRNLYVEAQEGRFREDLYYRLQVVPVELPPLRNRSGDIPILLNTMIKRFSGLHNFAPPSFTKPAMKALDLHKWPGNVRELRNFCERMVILFNGKEIGLENLPLEIRNSHFKNNFPAKIADLLDMGLSLVDFEIQLIQGALLKTNGNQTKAARLLGLTRDTLLYRIKKHAISI